MQQFSDFRQKDAIKVFYFYLLTAYLLLNVHTFQFCYVSTVVVRRKYYIR